LQERFNDGFGSYSMIREHAAAKSRRVRQGKEMSKGNLANRQRAAGEDCPRITPDAAVAASGVDS